MQLPRRRLPFPSTTWERGTENADGSTVISNDDWQDSQEMEITQTGLAPTETHESALVTSLSDGPYTAIVFGPGGATGVALVEIYIVL